MLLDKHSSDSLHNISTNFREYDPWGDTRQRTLLNKIQRTWCYDSLIGELYNITMHAQKVQYRFFELQKKTETFSPYCRPMPYSDAA